MNRASYGIALRLEGYRPGMRGMKRRAVDPDDAWAIAANPKPIGPRRGFSVRGYHPDR